MLNVKINMTDVLMVFGIDRPDTTLWLVYDDSKEVVRCKNGIPFEALTFASNYEVQSLEHYENMSDAEFKNLAYQQRMEALDDAEAWDEQKLIQRDGDWAGTR